MLDLAISQAVQSTYSNFSYKIMEFFTKLGDVQTIVFLLILTTTLFLYKKRYRETVLLISSVVSSAIIGTLLKAIINRPRPTPDQVTVYALETSQSFPSNHALVSIVFFGLLALFINKKSFTLTSMIIVFLIGLSRIFLGVHWASDVIAGYLIGFLVILFVKTYFYHAGR